MSDNVTKEVYDLSIGMIKEQLRNIDERLIVYLAKSEEQTTKLAQAIIENEQHLSNTFVRKDVLEQKVDNILNEVRGYKAIHTALEVRFGEAEKKIDEIGKLVPFIKEMEADKKDQKKRIKDFVWNNWTKIVLLALFLAAFIEGAGN